MYGLAGRAGDGHVAPSAPSPRLAGFHPAGMLDWPGRVTATLFLSGCTFRCAYCHNPDLQRVSGSDIGWPEIVDHLRAKRSWLDGVVVSGGEPTEDPDLPSLLAALAAEGVPVKLDTNGSRPEVLAALIAEQLVEYVALDVKATPERYRQVTGSCSWDPVGESIELLISSGIAHEFRTTAYPEAVSLGELGSIASRLRGGMLFAIQQFKPAAAATEAARSCRPYDPAELQNAARLCNVHLPTVVRGT